MIREKQDIRKIIMAVLATLLLVGCGANVNPAGYLEGALNARYKAEYELYMDVKGCSLEDAKLLHEECLNECMAVIESAGLSDELKVEYKEFFERVLRNVSFQVGDVTEEDGTYSVQVTLKPYAMFENIAEELSISVDDYYTEVTEDALEGTELPSSDEVREEVYTLLLEILNNHMNHISYAEPIIQTIEITQSDDHMISIDQDDLKELHSLLINMESMGL